MKKALLLVGLSFICIHGAEAFEIINQNSSDITLLRAFVTNATVGDYLTDLSDCYRRHKHPYSSSFDCKKAIEEKLGALYLGRELLIREYRTGSGKSHFDPAMEELSLVEIHTVTKEAAFRNLDAVGFYIDWVPEKLYFTKDKLVEIGRVKLQDGTTGIVHRFLAKFQPTWSRKEGHVREIEFKPFVDFYRFSEGNIYRNWDLFPSKDLLSNYSLISGVPGLEVLRIDRSKEVLLNKCASSLT